MSPVFTLSSRWEATARLAEQALTTGLSLLLLSSLVLACGLLAGWLLSPRGPVLRSLAYRATLIGLLGAVLLSIGIGSHLPAAWRLPVAASRVRVAPLRVSAIGKILPTAYPLLTTAPHAESPCGRYRPRPAASLPGGGLGLSTILISLWALGSLVLLAWLAGSQAYAVRAAGRAVAIEGETLHALDVLCRQMRIRRPRLLACPGLRSPFATVLPRPAILLPAGLVEQLDRPALRALLAHEAAHLARGDCWWRLLCRLATALLWPQPLLWLLVSSLEEAAEELCDADALRFAPERRVYARLLLDLALRCIPAPLERAAGVGAAPLRSSLGRRIRRLLQADLNQAPPSHAARSGAVLFAGAVALLGAAVLPTPAKSGADARPGAIALLEAVPVPVVKRATRSLARPGSRAASAAQPEARPLPAPAEAPVVTTGPVRLASSVDAPVLLPARSVIRPLLAAPMAAAPPTTAASALIPRAPNDYSDGQAAISGSVIDAAGMPVAGVQVAIEPIRARPGRPAPPDPRIFSGEAVTGRGGRYQIEGFGVGNYLVRMISEPSGRYAANAEAVWTEAGKTVTAPPIRLGRYAYVVGEVVDASTGKPIPDLVVVGSRSNGYAHPYVTDRARTDATGRFRLRLVEGNNSIFVSPPPPAGFRAGGLERPPGFRPGIHHFPLPNTRQQLRLEADETREIRFVIDPAKLGVWKSFEDLKRESEERKKRNPAQEPPLPPGGSG